MNASIAKPLRCWKCSRHSRRMYNPHFLRIRQDAHRNFICLHRNKSTIIVTSNEYFLNRTGMFFIQCYVLYRTLRNFCTCLSIKQALTALSPDASSRVTNDASPDTVARYPYMTPFYSAWPPSFSFHIINSYWTGLGARASFASDVSLLSFDTVHAIKKQTQKAKKKT